MSLQITSKNVNGWRDVRRLARRTWKKTNMVGQKSAMFITKHPAAPEST